ncbi:MAG: glutamine-hydrolyzing GMP synthase [Candidatus Auribacterota bacterium]
MDKIYVLDFGGQYAHLIANRIRRLHVFSEIKHSDEPAENLTSARGIILSGGPHSVYAENRPAFDPDIFKLNIPVLGLCFGHQLIVQEMGGIVEPGQKEYGVAHVKTDTSDPIFSGLAPVEQVWMSHGDSAVKLPQGFKGIGSTSDNPHAAICHPDKKIYGFQFHPEVTHTPHGMKMLDNFLDICACRRDWSIKSFLESIRSALKEQVKDRKVFMLVSGGVDSTVAFTLLNDVLGTDRVLGLNIDNGFCRKNEICSIKKLMDEQGYTNLLMQDHSETFLTNVKGVCDPEKKRRIIGKTFIDVANSAIKELNLSEDEWLLGQGTIYPDTIESAGTKNAALIKTHHNRVECVQDLIEKGLVVEPLAQLYKDEVRELGIELGLSEELVWRHPFPGPGLAVRVLCSDGILQEPLQELNSDTVALCKKHNLNVTVLPVRSVGVQGDSRSYEHPALLTGSQDWSVLEKASTHLTNTYKHINRVLALVAPETVPPMRLKESYLTRSRLDVLREADDLVMNFLHEQNLTRVIWQMPTVLLPLTSDGKKECVVLRPVITRDFMTARFAEIPWDNLCILAQEILETGEIDAVFYDVTHKPPGTIEWE